MTDWNIRFRMDLGGFGEEEKFLNLEEIREIYQAIEVLQNEQGIQELGFVNQEKAEMFVQVASQLSSLYIVNKTKFSMQFLADIMKKMREKNLITVQDLYELSEKEVIEKIETCPDKTIAESFKIWRNATQIKESDIPPGGVYFVNLERVKIRYINPLVKLGEETVRIREVSAKAKEDIERALRFSTKKYAYLDFDFK